MFRRGLKKLWLYVARKGEIITLLCFIYVFSDDLLKFYLLLVMCSYVETLMGRKRFLSKIKFGNSEEKSKAQRQAVNSICQV